MLGINPACIGPCKLRGTRLFLALSMALSLSPKLPVVLSSGSCQAAPGSQDMLAEMGGEALFCSAALFFTKCLWSTGPGPDQPALQSFHLLTEHTPQASSNTTFSSLH